MFLRLLRQRRRAAKWFHSRHMGNGGECRQLRLCVGGPRALAPQLAPGSEDIEVSRLYSEPGAQLWIFVYWLLERGQRPAEHERL